MQVGSFTPAARKACLDMPSMPTLHEQLANFNICEPAEAKNFCTACKGTVQQIPPTSQQHTKTKCGRQQRKSPCRRQHPRCRPPLQVLVLQSVISNTESVNAKVAHTLTNSFLDSVQIVPRFIACSLRTKSGSSLEGI